MLHVPVGRVGNGGSSNGGGNNGNNGGGNSGGGCLSNIGGCLVALILIALFFGVLGSFGSCVTHTQGESAGVTASTVEREKLSGVNYGADEGYFTDADGDWIHNSARMEAGLKEFYEQTGVQPYIYILPNGQETSPLRLSEMAEDLYNQLFDDGAHFLLVFCDDGLGGYNCGYWVGPEAKTIMDSEAISVLADYLDRYYAEADTEEEIFSEAFAKTAERIMHVEESSVPYVVVGLAIVVIAGVVVFIVKKRSEAKEAERKHKEAILNTPLEKFGDSSIDELEKKYAQDDGTSAEDLAKKYNK